LEHLAEQPKNRSDIFRLVDDLGIDSDHLFKLTEAAELLGFATIESGDITLTSLGETFAEASILARKEIFATRIRRLPIFRWLITLLRAAEKQQLQWDVIRTALELEFPPEEAERQLETVVNWGRYAEMIAYDDDEEKLYLESGGMN
jgi:NitT/TauT family transport system ATP-binding protein